MQRAMSIRFGAREIVWDFGTDTQYPVLCPVDLNDDGLRLPSEFGAQPRELPPLVFFAQSEFVVGEADGHVEVHVTMRNAPAVAEGVTVLFTDGTAHAPADYEGGVGAVVVSFDSLLAVDFLTTETFSIPIMDDTVFEGDETVHLSFAPYTLPFGVDVGRVSTAKILIDDVEDASRISFDVARQVVDEGDRLAMVSVHVDKMPVEPVSVVVLVGDASTAVSTMDFYLPVDEATLRFSSESLTQTFSVVLIDDNIFAGSKTIIFEFDTLPFGLSLGNLHKSTLVIEDDNLFVSFGVATLSVAEDVGTVPVLASLSVAPSWPIEIPITVRGTTSSNDYTWSSKSLSFSEVALSDSFVVFIVNDPYDEPAESIVFSFGALPVGVALGEPNIVTLTIEDDDLPPESTLSIFFESPSVRVYPNPVRDMLYIAASAYDAHDATLYTLVGTPLARLFCPRLHLR